MVTAAEAMGQFTSGMMPDITYSIERERTMEK